MIKIQMGPKNIINKTLVDMIMNLIGVISYLLRTIKVKYLLGYMNPEECLADQGQAF